MSPSDWLALPAALPALLLVPVLALLLRAREAARARRLVAVVGERAALLARTRSDRRRRIQRRLFVGGVLFALLAIVQPLWGTRTRAVEQRGIDVVIGLDVSRSMLARDLAPSRLQRAQSEVRALCERTRGDRLGLVAFAGEARLLVPRTDDTASFADLVESAGPLSVPRGGTDLGAALDLCLEALSSGEPGARSGVVLLLTDGEDLEGRGLAAAEACRQRGVAVHCVGFGSTLGSRVTIRGEGGAEEFLRSRDGDEVLSTMDAKGLRAIAAAANGAFVDAGSQRAPLVDVYERHVLPMANQVIAESMRDERENQYQVPLGIAFVLLLLELLVTDRRRP